MAECDHDDGGVVVVAYDGATLPFFFIMNIAVGGQWPGYPDDTTEFPQFMAVDYVRVFQ